MSQPPVIADYDPEWPRLFEREAAAVGAAVEGVRRIEHVGSTAVPGLAARPTIDLLAGAADPAAVDAGALAALGYTEATDVRSRTPGRRLFWKGTPAFRTYELHLVREGGTVWERALAFRERLRSDLDLAERYAHHKRQVARLYADSPGAYAEANVTFADAVLQGTDL